jgi:hypothetical protein
MEEAISQVVAWRPPVAPGLDQPQWYAAYTSANHEKRVAERLGVRELEHFLPLYESLR